MLCSCCFLLLLPALLALGLCLHHLQAEVGAEVQQAVCLGQGI